MMQRFKVTLEKVINSEVTTENIEFMLLSQLHIVLVG